MQYIHNFKLSISEYAKNGQDNVFPIVSHCPECHDQMIKNGFYLRYPMSYEKKYEIFIRRYRCKHCGFSISILPSFLLPHFQRTLKWLFQCIHNYYFKKKYILSRCQTLFYCTRFEENIPGMISYFRQKVNSALKFTSKTKKKAIKLIEMIKSFPTPTFARRYNNHFQESFMAN